MSATELVGAVGESSRERRRITLTLPLPCPGEAFEAAWVDMPRYMTDEQWDFMIDLLAAMKPGIVPAVRVVAGVSGEPGEARPCE